MPKRMLVHDARLNGASPSIAQNQYEVGAGDPTDHIIGWIGYYARSQGGIDELIVMCHGYAVLADNVAQMTRPDAIGGAGLQLGRDGLTLRNVGLTRNWRKPDGSAAIQKVYLYACGASAPSMYNDPFYDGRRFCGEMALHSGAEVYAADVLQWYTTGSTGVIDFGNWEGRVYKYSPDDGQPTQVKLPRQPLTL